MNLENVSQSVRNLDYHTPVAPRYVSFFRGYFFKLGAVVALTMGLAHWQLNHYERSRRRLAALRRQLKEERDAHITAAPSPQEKILTVEEFKRRMQAQGHDTRGFFDE